MKKRLKGLISVFFFLLCIFAWKSGQEVRAAENVITDFSRIFYIPAGAVLKGGSLQKLQEIYDGMSCVAYTEDGEELYLDAVWDYSGIDIQTVGAYKITGTVRLPEGYISNVGLPEWTAWISVQNPGQPEIQVYSRMISAGIYYFPWITEQNPDMMEIWLQREGEDWVNVSEEGYGFADTDGMYLSCQSMLAGNIYTLTVIYNEGKTRNLKYRYQSDGSLEILSYQPGTIGGTVSKDTVIRSCEDIDEKSLQRCMVYAVRAGQSLAEVRTELEETFYILGSTCEEYEDTAAHPAVVMPSVWDFSQVDVNTPGVYKVTGTFTAPEGCTMDPELTVPGAAAYITVQRPDQPEVQTCCVIGVDTLFFPMILDRFTDEQLDNLQVYLQENKEDKEIGNSNFCFDRKGLYLKKSVLKAGREYGIYVTYPGGSTGIYTFVYGGELISNEHWYKRNYADRDGKELPDIANETERVTDTSAILVGNRLLDLMKNGVKMIPFEGDGVLVRIPVEVVKDWNIKAEDQIETDISWVGSDISVKISKNGEAVTDIPGATVEIPYANRDSQTMLTDEDGNSYTGSVNDAQNAAVIPIDKTGDYTVEEQPQNQTESEGDTAEDDDLEEDSPENAEDLGEEKLSEQVEELLSEDVKNQKANSDENLNSQHKKTASIVIIIVILLILLWNIPMRRGKKLRKGERGEGEQSK